MGLGAAAPAHRGAMLWLVTWHCHLPLLAAQMTTSGVEDAAALREAKAAADDTDIHMAHWTADTEPCGDGYDSRYNGWFGVMSDARGGRVVYVDLPNTGVGGELLPSQVHAEVSAAALASRSAAASSTPAGLRHS